MNLGGGGAPENKLLKGNFLGFTLNLLSIKKPILPCHPEGRARRISKENKHKILRFAQNDKKCAFTMAEVLITLGIIGIVIAMTLPALIGKYQKLVTVTKLKKAYTTLSQMVIKSQEDNGPASFSTDAILEADVVKTFFDMYWKPYFNSPTVYKELTYPYGVSNPYFDRNGTTHSLSIYTIYSAGRILFTTDDGITYLLIMMKRNNEYDEEGNLISYTITYAPQQTVYVDVDGLKGQNTLGKDIFQFVIDFDNSVVRPLGYDKSKNAINSICSHNSTGQYCAAKIMNDGWEIKDDYPW